MDEKDRLILNIVQKGFPLEKEPFSAIGKQVGLEAEEVIDRLRRLKDAGIIRRLGAFFEPKKLGYVSTLCAARCPSDKEEFFISTVNERPEVTHNYRRRGEYNIWFTIIAPSKEEIESIIADLKKKTGVEDIISMEATKRFKIDARFEV
ncbi:MAG: AsnC family transcriptional regulator [Syntrophales bacterium]|nr:AsnC family transcriptional regulator [Syntrophales bacterium]